MSSRFIVAEITKNWTRQTRITDLLSHQFEAVINTNAERGYRLIDWKMSQVIDDDTLTETIIAVFEQLPQYAHAKARKLLFEATQMIDEDDGDAES